MAAATLTKGELLRWLNAELGADYHRIELLADGVAYLQLLDALNPGSAPLHKLNYSARFAEDRERNLALVEQTLARRGAALRVPVAELAKGGFQAHFDFLQRLHAYVRNERVQGRAHRKPPQASSASAQTPPQPPRAAARGDPAGASPRSPLQMAAALAEDSRFLGEERADAAPLTSAGDAHLQLTRGRELEELIASLELDIKSRVAAQRELLERVEQLSSERDFLLDRLLLVERAAADAPASPFARAVTSVLLDAQTELLSAQRPP